MDDKLLCEDLLTPVTAKDQGIAGEEADITITIKDWEKNLSDVSPSPGGEGWGEGELLFNAPYSDRTGSRDQAARAPGRCSNPQPGRPRYG
jgi:hypothetical protein